MFYTSTMLSVHGRRTMTSFKTNVTTEVLVWARERVKLPPEEAARKIGVSDATLERWETGEGSPTIIQLRKMAQVYKQPLAMLYLRRPPTDFDPIKSFRRLVQTADIELEYTLIIALERVSRQQEILLDILEDEVAHKRAAFPKVRLTEDAEATGTAIAEWLGLDLDQQRRWARRDALVLNLTRLIEQKGILVTQAKDIPLNLMRGCALTDHPIPAIVLNGADRPNPKTFTIIHELVHILLRASGTPDVVPVTSSQRAYDVTERYCNLVAATTLLPQAAFRSAVERASDASWRPDISDSELHAVASEFGISKQAVFIRMIGLGLESWENYQAFGWEMSERPTAVPETRAADQGNKPLYYPLKVRDLGRMFIEEVRAAYDRHEIGSYELADYLDVKWENIPKLMKRAGLPS